MGVKRWLLAFFILAVVVGLLAVIFFQAGADRRLIDSVLPSVEDRFDVEVRYEDVDVSLTSVIFEEVEVLPSGGERPLARIARVGVGIQVGPLIVGDLEITGVRLDGLEILAGERAGGAEADEWADLLRRLEDRGAPPGGAGRGASFPEILISSGIAEVGDGVFSASVRGLSGSVVGTETAVVGLDDFEVRHRGHHLVRGESGEIQYRSRSSRLTARLDRPELEVPGELRGLAALARDLRASMRSLLGEDPREGASVPADGGGPAGSGEGGGTRLSWKVALADASGAFVDAEHPEARVEVDDVTAEVSGASGAAASLRATGGLPGTDARWTAAVTRPVDGPPVIDIEVPDLPLAKVGGLIASSEHVDWDGAWADCGVEVEILRGGREISARGQASLSGLVVRHERLAAGPIEGLDLHADFKLTLDRDEGVVHLERVLLARGRARVTVRGDARLGRLAFDLRANIPPTACGQVLYAVPSELRAELGDVRLDGLFALDLHLLVDEEAPEDTVLEVDLDNRCGITDLGDVPEPNEFRRPFAYYAYTADDDRMRLVTGPGTDRWAPLSAISPYVIEALLTTEDGKFWRHSGVTAPEVEKAIELNLKKKSLKHGASTITMQLAKNLFLSRERTVARKVKELFLTWYLESAFTKEEILELYLNAVEFGPSVYGIRDAADHYFGREPRELDLLESVFLIRLLPNPVARHGSYVRGEITQRKLASLHRVMRTMRARGRISDEELEEGLAQEIAFCREGEPRPEPRPGMPRDAGVPRRLGVPLDDGTTETPDDLDDDEIWEEGN